MDIFKGPHSYYLYTSLLKGVAKSLGKQILF